MKKKTKLSLIITSVTILLCVCIGVYFDKNEKYKKGIAAIEENDYYTAEHYLEHLDFKDSQDLLKSFKYQKGITAIKENDYYTAEKYLKNLYFKDSQDLLKSFKNETYYNWGISAMSQGKDDYNYYEKAHRYFEEVSDYKDSKALAEKCESKYLDLWYEAYKAHEDSKVKCSFCNGTGKVKYYYGSSALEAYLSGHNDYEYGPCTSCDGKGYVYE